MRTGIWLSLVAWQLCLGQTQIDFQKQTKSETRPVKAGTILPGTCLPGNLFLKQDAPLGLNLYACLSTNTWTLQGTAGSAALMVQSDGVTVGTRPVQNYQSGFGSLHALVDTGTRIDILEFADTAVMQTRSNAQTGSDVFCESAGTMGQAYSCTALPVIPTYVRGMVLEWIPEVAVSGGAVTLAVDALTAVPVKLEDGVTDPSSADIVAGRLTPIWFDGAAFRLLGSVGKAASAASPPTCAVALRGRVWHTPGSTGVADIVAVCAKDSADVYAWRSIY